LLWFELTYFILSSTKKQKMLYTENGVITTLEFIIDNIYVEFGGHIYIFINLCHI